MLLRLFIILLTTSFVHGQQEVSFKICDIKNQWPLDIKLISEEELIDPLSGNVAVKFLIDKNPEIIYGINRPVYLNSDVPQLFNGFYKTTYPEGQTKEIKLMLAGMECMRALFYPSGSIKTLSYFNASFVRDAMNFKMNEFKNVVNNNALDSQTSFSADLEKKLHFVFISEKKNPEVYHVLKYNEKGGVELNAVYSVDFKYYEINEINRNIISGYKVTDQSLRNYELLRKDTIQIYQDKEFKKILKFFKNSKIEVPRKLRANQCVFTLNNFYVITIGGMESIPMSHEKLIQYRTYVRNFSGISDRSNEERKRLTGIDENYYQAIRLNYGDYLTMKVTFTQNNGDFLTLTFDGKGTLNGTAELYNSVHRLKLKGFYLNDLKSDTWSLYDTKFDVKKGISVYKEDKLIDSQGSVNDNDFSALVATEQLLNKIHKTEIMSCYKDRCRPEKYLAMMLTVVK